MSQKEAKKVTIYDVADAAKVSFKSVSRALNGQPGVSKKTADRILKIADKMGYVPNPAARRLAGNRTYAIALAFSGEMDSYIVDLQLGVLQACEPVRYDMIIHPCGLVAKAARENVIQFATQRRVDGLILTPPLCDDVTVTSELDRLGLKYVLISPKNHNHGMLVYFNEYQAAYDVTQRLINMNHKRIGFIKGNPSHGSSKSRYSGYRDALEDSDITLDPSIVAQGSYSFRSGKNGARKILDAASPPTAIFASDDDMAVGAIHYAHEQGIAVPDDLSIVGFDDVRIARSVYPSLTTVRQPIKTMGFEAAQMLFSALRDEQPSNVRPSATILDYEIIERDSTSERD
jgi:LacI family transcriptional regulator